MASLSGRLTAVLAVAAALTPVAANPHDIVYDARSPIAPVADANSLSRPSRRGTNEAPNGYVPTEVSCPSTRPSIRKGSNISDEELAWLPKRRNATIPYIRQFLERIAIPDFDSKAYLKDVETDSTALPNIGIAMSGGGYRAMLSGAGALAAWDIRTDGTTKPGNLGGLLQSATYLSGLSGGSWLIGSLTINNWTSVQESVNYGGIWQLQNSIFEGPEQYSLLGYYDDVFDAVKDKKDAGFERSITDYWGRMLSYQLVNATDGGPGITWSSIVDDTDFKNGDAPLPLVVIDSRNPGETIIALNSTVFEVTPWELGSYDPAISGFAPLKYVGSEFENGQLPKDKSCVRGFDNAGYVMGTSSSLFNQIILYLNDDNSSYVPDNVPHFAIDAVKDILKALGSDNDDIADWSPNPFRGWNKGKNPFANNDRLTLVDGGEDLQNVPYYPHLRNERHVDVVFSYDSSADTDSFWPNGASAVATYQRSLENISEGSSFPVVPGQDTFINLGLNARPTFFGCNATNTTTPSPLIVYIPNYPYVYAANISTFQMSINTTELTAIIENGYSVATQLNGTVDKDWPCCVGCAMLARSFDRTNTTYPAKCQSCFESYCWNGTIDEKTPAPYYPKFVSTAIDVESFAHKVLGNSITAAVAAIVAALTLTL
ncbi:lysophospholipase catalytic domain-containing protein [Mariannaea sp. PMI_226]|nr:lysophospholipase catalytic domain-containing protein [Mariannaea sp. PMI_226]